MQNELASKQCIPCQGGVPPLKGDELKSFHAKLQDGWRVVDEHHIEKDYKFDNYMDGVDFTNRLAKLAEEQGHHPDILLVWGKVTVTLWTHKIDGLSESDFIFAAKTDELR